MLSMECSSNLEFSESKPKPFDELPCSHIENMDLALLEKQPLEEAMERISDNYYSSYVENHPGLLRAFFEVSGGAGKDAFEKHYSDYVCHSEQMKKEAPDIYAFMRERVFWGKEYDGESDNTDISSLFADFLETKELDKAPSMEVQVSEIKECFEAIPELRYENWVNMDMEARLDKLNELEKKVAKIEHRLAVEVRTEEMRDGSRGYYDSTICLSQSILNGNSEENYRITLRTLFHEGRHAYQDYNLYNKEVEQNSEMIDAWRVNLEKLGYESGNRLIFKELGFQKYYTQPVEVDSRVFAEAAMKKLGV